jgi:hypothetical protein
VQSFSDLGALEEPLALKSTLETPHEPLGGIGFAYPAVESATA